jgi:hypothetical protein
MSDDDILAGSDIAPAPTDVPGSVAPPPANYDQRDEIINRNRDIALSQLAKSEDIGSYVDERIDQGLVIDHGEDLGPERQAKWFRRASKALQDAALEAQGVKLDEHGQVEADQLPPPGYVPADEAAREIEEAHKMGAAQMRINQYLGGNEELRQQITDWHAAEDPEGTVAQWVIDSGTEMAGPIMARCAQHPEALRELASLPPEQRSRWLSKLEGHLETELRIAAQLQQQQQQAQWTQGRRVSNAPPPINPPRGAASPPSDLFRLASKGESVDDYVRMRQQQERKPR